MRTLGQTIKILREKNDVQQKDLAIFLNVHKATMSNWELDKRHPDQETIVKIADYFNVSVDYLFGRTEDPNSEIVTFKDGENLFEVELEKGTKEKLTGGQLQALIKKLEAVNFDVEKLIEKIKQEEN